MSEETSYLTDPAWARVLRCWGKTDAENPKQDMFHPAVYHMLDAGNIARELLGKSASPRWRGVLSRTLGARPENLIDWIPWLVALHDIGKISADFQGQIEAQKSRLKSEGFSFGRKSELQHGLVGQAFIWENGEKLSRPPLPAPLRKIWRDTVGGHHGQFCAPGEVANTRAVLRKDEPPEWASLRLITAKCLTANFLLNHPENWPDPQNISAAIMALTGFTILCDWLGSNRDYFKVAGEMEYEKYAPESNRRAHIAVVKSGFFQPCYSLAPTSFAGLFPGRADTIRPLQQAIDDIPENFLATPCLAVIEAPTGRGQDRSGPGVGAQVGPGQQIRRNLLCLAHNCYKQPDVPSVATLFSGPVRSDHPGQAYSRPGFSARR